MNKVRLLKDIEGEKGIYSEGTEGTVEEYLDIYDDAFHVFPVVVKIPSERVLLVVNSCDIGLI